MPNMLLASSKVLMRTSHWRAAAIMLARMSFSTLDAESRGRLSYALLMLHRTDAAAARGLLAGVIAQDDLTAPLLVELATMATRVNDEATARDLLARAMAASNDTATYDAAATLQRLHQSLADGSLPSRIGAMIDAAALPANDLLTLVPVSRRYLELWSLWIGQVRQHIGGTIVALAMDDETLSALQSEPNVAMVDVREFFAWSKPGTLHDVSRGVLWQVRTLVLRNLVQRGHNVLVLDLDAIAIATVKPVLDSIPDADVIGQKDHSLPMDVARQLGFIVCCGFMLWRPTDAAKALADRFATEAIIERDDQMALNHILGIEGITNQREVEGTMLFESAGVRFACPDPAKVSRTLHSGTVVRHFQQEGHTVEQLRQALGLNA
jgi:hypothetical protein